MEADTADSIYGVDPHAPPPLAAPGSVGGTPAAASQLTGLRGMHPGISPTPWVIGMAIVLALLLHPKAGFNAGGRVAVG